MNKIQLLESELPQLQEQLHDPETCQTAISRLIHLIIKCPENKLVLLNQNRKLVKHCAKLMSEVGQYHLQLLILEFLFRLTPRAPLERSEFMKDLHLDGLEIIHAQDFDQTCVQFLEQLNLKNDGIHSFPVMVQCIQVQVFEHGHPTSSSQVKIHLNRRDICFSEPKQIEARYADIKSWHTVKGATNHLFLTLSETSLVFELDSPSLIVFQRVLEHMQVKKSMRVSTVAEPIRLTQQDPRSDSLFSDHMSPVKHNIRRIPSSSLSPPLETIQKMSSPPKHPREISAQVKSEQSLDLSSPPKRERSPSLYQDMPAKKQSKRVKRPAGHRRTSTRLSQNKPKGLEDQSMVEEKRKKVIDSPSPLKQTKRRRTTQFVPSANSPEFRDQNQGFTPINPRLLFAGFKIPDTPHDTSKVHSGDDGSVTPKQPEETPKPLFPQQRVRLGEMSPVPKVSKTGSTFLNAGQSTPTPSVPAKSLELSVSRRGKTVNPRDKNVKPNDEILETYVQKMTVNTGKKAVKQGKNTKRPGKAVQRQKVPTETVGSPSISPPPVRSHLPLDPPLFSSNNLLKPPHVSADLPLDTPKRTKIEDHVKSTPELSRTTDRLTPPPISKKQYAESVTPTRLQESFCQRPVSPQTSPFSSLSKELLEKDQLQDIFNRVHAVDAMILDPRQLCQTSVKSSA